MANKRTAIVIVGIAVLAVVGAGLWFLSAGNDGSGGMAPDDPKVVALGKAVYARECASCHGASLKGDPDWRRRLPDGGLRPPPHDETGHTWHHPDGYLFQITKDGGQKSAPPGFKSNMPGFGDKLSDAEIWAALSYIKSRWPAQVRRRHDSINARARQSG
jgi:mono/diheme cytochrome c family protein